MGWKDILRPIRDGLRDNLPERKPDHDNDAEKRRKLRDSDALKGFAYFETFADIEKWTPESVDTLQRANTPLLCRAPLAVSGGKRAKVVLIHDYSGNYHEYEACQGSSSAKESYSCEYMQFIDSFVYFSHKLVCVPPPTWTNSLHRNGVKSYGTFLVEPQTPDITRILQRRAHSEVPGLWEYPIATQLAEMAKIYGFDGWLLNLEKTFPLSRWSRERLSEFIAQLNSAIGEGNVIWYDALTVHNTLQYQNGLTKNNGLFAQAAGLILTNYDWTVEKASAAKERALELGIDPSNVVFGIDVWAQNSQFHGPQRTTFGGGGTSTGIAVAKLAELGLSAGVFAPAWAYEHFPEFSKAVEGSIWVGDRLPTSLSCDCRPEGRHDTSEYMRYPITKSAIEYSAGSESFFYTNFARAFTTQSTPGEMATIVSHVGAQSILPHLRGIGGTRSTRDGLHGVFLSSPPRLGIFAKATPSRPGVFLNMASSRANSYESPICLLELFKLSMPGTLEVQVTYRKQETPEGMKIGLAFDGAEAPLISVPPDACEQVTVVRTLGLYGDDLMDRLTSQSTQKLTGIKLRVEGNTSELEDAPAMPILEILEICIKRKGTDERTCSISNISIDGPDHLCRRLSWSFKDHGGSGTSKGTGNDGIPYSEITGPFAFFVIRIDGEVAGRAYALAYLLTEEMGRKIDEEQDMKFEIAGYAFDGKELCVCTCSARDMRKRDDNDTGSWQLLQPAGSSSDITMESVGSA